MSDITPTTIPARPDTAHPDARPLYQHYGIAVLSVLLALEVRMLLTPFFGLQFPFATFILAVFFTAWYAGLRPALLTLSLGLLAAAYFFLPPLHSFIISGPANRTSAAIYILISLTSALFSQSLRSAQLRAEASALEAQKNEAALRQSEQAMRVSDARKTAILETALDCVLTMDHTGKLIEFNPAAEQTFGYGRTEVVGQEMAQFLIPASLREHHRQGLAHYLATGEGALIGQRIETIALRADGTEFPIELAITRIPGDGPPLFSGTIRDITAQKKTATRQRFFAQSSELLASSLDYQTTLQSIAQLAVPHLADWFVIHLINEAGNLELVTVAHADPAKTQFAWDAARRYPLQQDALTGPAAVARTGKSEWIETITEEMIRAGAKDEEHYRTLMESGMRSYLCVPLTARGRFHGAITFIGAESGHHYRPDDVEAAEELARRAAIAIDNAQLYRAAQQELEERRRAEEALKESRDHYRTLTEALPQLVWMTRPDGVPEYFNQQWFDYTGQVPDDTNTWWRGGVHPDEVDDIMQRWTSAVQTGEPYSVEYRLKGADGVHRWFLARGVPLKNERGEVLKWFGTCTLIEDQKRTEQTQRFLADLSERIRVIADPEEVLSRAVNLIGDYLGVEHCFYAEIDMEQNVGYVHQDHCRGEPSMVGTYPLEGVSASILAQAKHGSTIANKDTRTDPLTRDQYAATYQPIQVRAFIVVPILKDGRLMGMLNVTSSQPRTWTEDDIALLETVAERTWFALVNARLFQAERERSEQLALAISEVHHRVKNNLQAVSALLELRITPGTTLLPIAAVQDSLSQIKTIALVHDLLARDRPMGTVNVAQVLTNLAELLSVGMRSGNSSLPIRVDAEPIWMTTKAATSLALIVNELLTNSAKHNDRIGRENLATHEAIEVSLHRQGEDICVAVQDYGPGFPSDFDPTVDGHIGLQLVTTLVEHDLHGSITFANSSDQENGKKVCGGRVAITFSERSVPE
jgi:PAS domain S-box-containing protein